MEFTAEELAGMYDKLHTIIDTHISEPRRTQLKAFYDKFQERILLAPASSIEHFHNAFPGGYLDHVLRVTENAIALAELWEVLGADVSTFTKEELVFSALNHDLGKIGDEEHEHYIPNKSDWHRTNQGKIYATNPAIINMDLFDRGMYLLQKYGIVVTINEYIAMRCADGIYKEANKEYMVTFDAVRQLKSNLPIILHHADMLALHTERDKWRAESKSFEGNVSKISPQTSPKKTRSVPEQRNEKTRAVFESSRSSDLKKQFDDMFSSKGAQ